MEGARCLHLSLPATRKGRVKKKKKRKETNASGQRSAPCHVQCEAQLHSVLHTSLASPLGGRGNSQSHLWLMQGIARTYVRGWAPRKTLFLPTHRLARAAFETCMGFLPSGLSFVDSGVTGATLFCHSLRVLPPLPSCVHEHQGASRPRCLNARRRCRNGGSSSQTVIVALPRNHGRALPSVLPDEPPPYHPTPHCKGDYF